MSARGEGIIRAGDKEFRIIFNNRALAEAEQQMGKSVIGVLRGFETDATGITELAHLLRAGLTAAQRENGRGKPATLVQAYLVLDAAGFARVAEVVGTTVAEVLGYSPDASTGSEAGDEDDEEADPNE